MAWRKAGRSMSGQRASFLPALVQFRQLTFLPLGIGLRVFGRRRQYIEDVPLDRGYLVALVLSDTQEIWITFNRGRY